MRVSTLFAVCTATLAQGHYIFPKLGAGGDWQYIRRTTSYQSNAPIQNVAAEGIRCMTPNGGSQGAKTTDVAAGGTITFGASPNIFHPGPLSGWMAKVPANMSVEAWDGAGAVWFKTYQETPQIGPGGMTWSSLNRASVSFTIPRCILDGEYLFRVEHNALHGASSAGGAQFYISCAQIRVTGGTGQKMPSSYVAFPGAYKATDPGIMVNIYTSKSYTPAGPPVFAC